MTIHIAIVEDEIELASLMADYARAAGYTPQVFHDGGAALSAMTTAPPDLIVLDLMLPGLDGLSLCRSLRARTDVLARIPIIMVTARVEEIDRLLGLDSGADDYLCKPFSPRELMARIRALLRRVATAAPAPVIEVDEAGQRILVHGTALALTRTEFDLLATLARRPGQVLSRARLLDAVRHDNLDATERAIDSHVKNLRRKIAAIVPEGDAIASVYGLGYRLDL